MAIQRVCIYAIIDKVKIKNIFGYVISFIKLSSRLIELIKISDTLFVCFVQGSNGFDKMQLRS